jgi:hypothetical protein
MQKAKSLKQTGPGIQDEEQWARNVEGYMRGLFKSGINVCGCSNPYSALAVVWEQMVSMAHFKTCRYCRLVRSQALLGNSRVVPQQLWMTNHNL